MTKTIDELIAASSVGAGLADIKERGIDAHLVDLEQEMKYWRLNRRAHTERTPRNMNEKTNPIWLRRHGVGPNSRLHVMVQVPGHGWLLAIDERWPGGDEEISHIWEGWIDTAKPDPIKDAP